MILNRKGKNPSWILKLKELKEENEKLRQQLEELKEEQENAYTNRHYCQKAFSKLSECQQEGLRSFILSGVKKDILSNKRWLLWSRKVSESVWSHLRDQKYLRLVLPHKDSLRAYLRNLSEPKLKELVEYGDDGPYFKLMQYTEFVVECYELEKEEVVYVNLTLDGTRAGVAVFNLRIIHPKINPSSLKHVHTCMVYYGSDDKASINGKVVPSMQQLLDLWRDGDKKRDNHIVTWNGIKYSLSFLNDLKCHWDFFDFKSKYCYKHGWGKLDVEVEADLEELYETDGKEITVTLKRKDKSGDDVVICGKVVKVEVEDGVFKFVVEWKENTEMLKGCLSIPVWMLRIDFLLHGRKRIVSGIFSYEWKRVLKMKDKREKEKLLAAGNNAMSIALGRAWRYDECVDHRNKFDLKCESGEGL